MDSPLVERLEGGIGHLLKIRNDSTGSRIRSGDCWLDWDCLFHASRTMMCVCRVQGKALVDRLKGNTGHLLGICECRLPQQEQLVGAELQGNTREVL